MHNGMMRTRIYLRQKFLPVFFASVCSLITCMAQEISIILHSNWKFRKSGEQEWMNASVPGTVHTDLQRNGKIPDPFFGANEQELQWIDTCDWEYQTWFTVTDSILQYSHCELSFEGLDTYATVYLNGQEILSADNMFRTWNVECKKFLVPDKNQLVVRFASAVRKGKEEADRLGYTLPGEEKVFTRKAQYHYGWDWGPRFVTCGIWRDVKLVCRNSFFITGFHVQQNMLTDSVAKLRTELTVDADEPTVLELKLTVDQRIFRSVQNLRKGENTIRFPLEIKNPRRWWCNGQGSPALYIVSMHAVAKDGSTQSISRQMGLRSVELVQEKDSSGKSFYFKLNGRPVFMKGANWIPADHFLPRVTKDKYRKLLLDAKEANINMLRVWGGGVYEDNAFYDLCDSLGILVWQDFMFACAMYPGDAAFLENVRAEIDDNVRRLRDHPCIALWCGNNEIDEGWKNWDWQKQYHYSQKDSAKIWDDYRKLFAEQIPKQLSRLDSTRAYWESSPSIGWGNPESLREGDSHYWGVWWGMEPFESYKYKVGRFMSEYGFQGMPSMQTIETFTSPAERRLSSASIQSHQKHPRGFETIDHYMDSWYKKPATFEGYIYCSQLLQAEAIRSAILAHRNARPYCMGTLYWQLNDCWPVTSWSSIDYGGRWKAAQYAVSEAFQTYTIYVEDTGADIHFNIVSDDTMPLTGYFKFIAEDVSGNELANDSVEVTVEPGRCVQAFTFPKNHLNRSLNGSRSFLRLEFSNSGKRLARTFYYLSKPKDLILEKPVVHTTFSKKGNSCSVTLTTNTFVKNIFLDIPGTEIRFSENYFDLPAKEIRTVSFESALSTEELEKRIVIRSLWDFF